MALSDPATDKQIQMVYSAYMRWLFKCVGAEKRTGDAKRAEKLRFYLASNPLRATFFKEAGKRTRSEISAIIEQLSESDKVLRHILFNWTLAQIETKVLGSTMLIHKHMKS